MSSSERDAVIYNPCVFCKRNFNVEGHLKTCTAVHWNDSKDVEMEVKLYPPTIGTQHQMEEEEQTIIGQHVIYASRLSKAPVSTRKAFAQARRRFPPEERAQVIEMVNDPSVSSDEEDDLLVLPPPPSSDMIQEEEEAWESDESYSSPKDPRLMPSIQPKEKRTRVNVRRRVNEREKENKRRKICHLLGYRVLPVQPDLFHQLVALFKGFKVSRREKLWIDVAERDPERFQQLERLLAEFIAQHLGTAYQLVLAHLDVAVLKSKKLRKKLAIAAIVALDDTKIDIFTDEKSQKTVSLSQGSIFLCQGASFESSTPHRQLHLVFEPKYD